MKSLPISCVVLTGNEELNIQRCLASIAGHSEDIIVVDSFSSDRTLEIARKYTSTIYQHEYEGHPHQWAWTLQNVPFMHDWIFAIDADFIVTPELWTAIADAVISDPPVDGYFVRHRQVFRGRPLKYGTIYPRHWLRVFRKQRVHIDLNDLVDIHFDVQGPVAFLEADIVEDNSKDRDLRFWVDKQARFARSLAQEELRRRSALTDSGVGASPFGRPDQRIMWWKKRWYELPLYVRPFLLFVYRYIFRLGFMDGKEGLLYHFTQALLCRLLVDAWLDELRTDPISIAGPSK
jgi:glycosyltransferase involved in cell wall biosynthesis